MWPFPVQFRAIHFVTEKHTLRRRFLFIAALLRQLKSGLIPSQTAPDFRIRPRDVFKHKRLSVLTRSSVKVYSDSSSSGLHSLAVAEYKSNRHALVILLLLILSGVPSKFIASFLAYICYCVSLLIFSGSEDEHEEQLERTSEAHHHLHPSIDYTHP